MPPQQKQKLYCYVDETGQDPGSNVFIVVAIVNSKNQAELRQALIDIEQETGTSHQKWHRLSPRNRLDYLDLTFKRKIAANDIFFGVFKKPLSFF